jgi:hypothetical protein
VLLTWEQINIVLCVSVTATERSKTFCLVPPSSEGLNAIVLVPWFINQTACPVSFFQALLVFAFRLGVSCICYSKNSKSVTANSYK